MDSGLEPLMRMQTHHLEVELHTHYTKVFIEIALVEKAIFI